MGDDGPPTDHDDGAAVRAQVSALLAAAGLEPPDSEIDRLAGLYPGLRRSLDRFHEVDTGDDVTAAVFRAGEVGTDDETGGSKR
ncbi:MAG: hypothetical protein AAFO29_15210 [Actinomycetota bacterium]